MPLDPFQSRAAMLLWSLSWVPGLFLYARRLAQLLPAQRLRRAAGEGALIAALPLAAWALYVVSEAMRQAQAQAQPPVAVWPLVGAIAQGALPYLVTAGFAFWRHRGRGPSAARTAPGPWWVAAVLAVASIPFLTPGLFMAQLMLLFGG